MPEMREEQDTQTHFEFLRSAEELYRALALVFRNEAMSGVPGERSAGKEEVGISFFSSC
jgi:hypothetical protein